ncbi:MAG: PfkB family carbohydrate kinase, partial [Brevefilum sp.]
SLKMNLNEALSAVKHLDSDTQNISENDPISAASTAAEVLWAAYQKPVFITLGAKGIGGMADGTFFHIPGFLTEGPIDIVGAGDSVLAGIGLSLCAGATAKEAAYIGNLVGSITIQQIGTTGKATQHDLRQRHKEYQQQSQGLDTHD